MKFSIKNIIEAFQERRKKAIDERERIENELEAKEYIKRKERYNDMLRDEALKQKFLNNMSKIKVNTYTKKLVAIIIAFCILCITASYVLAFMERDNTLESLSTQLCITILGTAFVYMIRAYFDSKAEHKNLDNRIKEELEEGLTEKLQNTLSEAGLNINIHNIFNKDEEPENEDNDNNDEEENPISGGYHINPYHNNNVGSVG